MNRREVDAFYVLWLRARCLVASVVWILSALLLGPFQRVESVITTVDVIRAGMILVNSLIVK